MLEAVFQKVHVHLATCAVIKPHTPWFGANVDVAYSDDVGTCITRNIRRYDVIRAVCISGDNVALEAPFTKLNSAALRIGRFMTKGAAMNAIVRADLKAGMGTMFCFQRCDGVVAAGADGVESSITTRKPMSSLLKCTVALNR